MKSSGTYISLACDKKGSGTLGDDLPGEVTLLPVSGNPYSSSQLLFCFLSHEIPDEVHLSAIWQLFPLVHVKEKV